jgi:glycine betaine/proline transport system ATP-binding protein
VTTGSGVSIELRALTKLYGAKPQRGLALLRDGVTRQDLTRHGYVLALNDVDLKVHSGEIYVVMGLSGSGKSTLVRCINRLVEPTAGQVLIEGLDITQLRHRELRQVRVHRLGMVFQQFALFPHLTILENIAFGLRVMGVSRQERRSRASEALHLVGLAGWGDRKPRELSGGMQQRVGLARALALNTPILLMDEPFGSLDPLIREEMQGELLRLRKSLNKTVVFITHDLHEAITLGSRVAILRNGEIVQEGCPTDIILKPKDKYVEAFVREVNILKILRADQALDDTGPVLRMSDWGTTRCLAAEVAADRPIVVLDGEGRPVGTLDASRTQVGVTGRLADLASPDFVRLSHDALVNSHLAEIAEARRPVIIVDVRERYLGVITGQSIIKAIATVRRPIEGTEPIVTDDTTGISTAGRRLSNG